MLDEFREMLANLKAQEKQAIFDHAAVLGEIHGRVLQMEDLIKKLEEERKVVDIAGKSAETTARDNQPEKR